MAGKNKGLHMTAFILLVVGGLNWLLVGVLPNQWEIGSIFGGMDNIISRIIYILVGLSALYELVTHKSNCKACKSSGSGVSQETSGGPTATSGGEQNM